VNVGWGRCLSAGDCSPSGSGTISAVGLATAAIEASDGIWGARVPGALRRDFGPEKHALRSVAERFQRVAEVRPALAQEVRLWIMHAP
jgi:hypothetical protein